MGSIIGPFKDPPFLEWCHVAPLMTRPKRDPGDRRVSSDLTCPQELSVNAYIIKNSVFGIEQEHSLPNVDGFVEDLKDRQQLAGHDSHYITLFCGYSIYSIILYIKS